MSKTIKQQADYLWPENDELSSKQANAYMMGANAVLHEVLKFMDDNKYISYDDVRKFIKQLKG